MGSDKAIEKPLSLLDLAILFVRYRAVFYSVVFVTMLGSITWYFITSPSYQFTTVIALAERSPGEPIANPESVLAMVSSRWLTQAEKAFFKREGRKVPFETQVVSVEGGELLKLVSEASLEQLDMVTSIHQVLADEISANQNKVLERSRDRLQLVIEETEALWESLRKQNNAGPALTAVTEQLVALKRELGNFTEARVVSVAAQSSEPTSLGLPIKIAFSAVIGIGLGVFLVYVVAFCVEVRREWLKLKGQNGSGRLG